jgi:hypothetical protein
MSGFPFIQDPHDLKEPQPTIEMAPKVSAKAGPCSSSWIAEPPGDLVAGKLPLAFSRGGRLSSRE